MRTFILKDTGSTKLEDCSESKTFETMKLIPEAQQAFASKLTDEEFIRDKYTEWSRILSNPEECRFMIRCIKSFRKETQITFFKRLQHGMNERNFLKPEQNFHPEILALKEMQDMAEIILANPALDEAKLNLRRFFISDYPLLCYAGLRKPGSKGSDKGGSRSASPDSAGRASGGDKVEISSADSNISEDLSDEDEHICRLVMVHLCDPEAKQKSFDLEAGETFLAFVETIN